MSGSTADERTRDNSLRVKRKCTQALRLNTQDQNNVASISQIHRQISYFVTVMPIQRRFFVGGVSGSSYASAYLPLAHGHTVSQIRLTGIGRGRRRHTHLVSHNLTRLCVGGGEGDVAITCHK